MSNPANKSDAGASVQPVVRSSGWKIDAGLMLFSYLAAFAMLAWFDFRLAGALALYGLGKLCEADLENSLKVEAFHRAASRPNDKLTEGAKL